MFLLNSILPFVGMLVGLIVIHELGHYITAKIFGVKVLEAGLGYPPRAWGFTWRGTLYSINWLPLGGFVRLLGEEDPSDPQSLAAQPAWKRLIVLASGSGMNFVLPIVLFAVAFMLPRQVPVGPAIIDVVEPGSPAAQAGLQPGDHIISINGEKMKNSLDVGRQIRLNMGDTITFKIQRDVFGGGTQVVTANAEARWDPPSGQGPTGIKIANLYPQFRETEQYSLLHAIPKGWTSTIDALTLARNQVISFFHGGSGPDVAGPVGIASATGDVVKEAGWKTLLDFAALLSINLAIVNILPLPMLDGWRIGFVLLAI